jgi:hypothetical protein
MIYRLAVNILRGGQRPGGLFVIANLRDGVPDTRKSP